MLGLTILTLLLQVQPGSIDGPIYPVTSRLQCAESTVPLFIFAGPCHVGLGLECTCSAVTGSRGEAITVTRSSSAYCYRSDGAILSCGNNLPQVEGLSGQLFLRGEESRTNALQRSEEFDNAYWTKGDTTVTANAIVSPDLTTSTDLVVEAATTAQHSIVTGSVVSFTNATSYMWSFWVKDSGRFLYAWYNAGAGQVGCAINPATGVVSACGSGASGACSTGYAGSYLCALRFVANATATGSVGINLTQTASGSADSYLGNGTSGVYLFGSDFETGAYATSYIKTTSAAVTRSGSTQTFTTPLANGAAIYCARATMVAPGGLTGTYPVGNTAFLQIGNTVTRNGQYWTGSATGFTWRAYDSTGAEKRLTGPASAAGINTFLAAMNSGTMTATYNGVSNLNVVGGPGTGLNSTWGATSSLIGGVGGTTGWISNVAIDNTTTGCN